MTPSLLGKPALQISLIRRRTCPIAQVLEIVNMGEARGLHPIGYRVLMSRAIFESCHWIEVTGDGAHGAGEVKNIMPPAQGTFDRDEVGSTLICDSLGQQCLAAPGGAVKQDAGRYREAQLLEPLLVSDMHARFNSRVKVDHSKWLEVLRAMHTEALFPLKTG